jgi:hypothetical protein
VIASGAFLDGADASLDFWNVLVFIGDIAGRMEAGGDAAAAAFEFHIRMNLVILNPR